MSRLQWNRRRKLVDESRALDMSKSLNEGAILLPDYKVGGWEWSLIKQLGKFDFDQELRDFTDEELQ